MKAKWVAIVDQERPLDISILKQGIQVRGAGFVHCIFSHVLLNA